MKTLVDVLRNSQISSLIRSKSIKSKQLVTVTDNDTILTALEKFVQFDISAIPIFSLERKDIMGMLSVLDLFKFIILEQRSQEEEEEGTAGSNLKDLLETKIGEISKTVQLKRASQLREQTNLLHLLLDMWDGMCKLDCRDYDYQHLLVRCIDGHTEVITPIDFLRFLFISSSSKSDFLRDTCSNQIKNSRQVDEASTAVSEESAQIALRRLLNCEPHHVLALVDSETGALQAGLTILDFLPASSNGDTAIPFFLLQDKNLTLFHFLQAVKNPRFLINLEPVLIHEHASLGDIIEKLVKLKIHQLWRVTDDRFRRPIETIGATEIISFLAKEVRNYIQTENPVL